MKRTVHVLTIFLSVVLVFAAAELLPVLICRYNDRDRCNRIIMEKDVAEAGKIAYELSEEDKLRLLANTEGILSDSSFTKVYEIRSREKLNTYDTTVLLAFENSIETMKDMGLLPLSKTFEDIESCLTDACCVFVGNGENGSGSLTLWVLTFQQNDRKWQAILDVSEEKLYGMYICDERLADMYREAEETSDQTQENREKKNVFMPWGTEELQLYFEGYGYDGYGMEIRGIDDIQEMVYIPVKTEIGYRKKDNFYITCFMLGEEYFYERLAEVVDDLTFLEFCYSTEAESVEAKESAKLIKK